VRLELIREQGNTGNRVKGLQLTSLPGDEGDMEGVCALTEAGVPLKFPRF
jgi:hypothetical protein